MTLRSLYSSVNGERYAEVHCKTSISTDVAMYTTYELKFLMASRASGVMLKEMFLSFMSLFCRVPTIIYSFVPFLFSHGGSLV